MLIQIYGTKKCKDTQAAHRFFSERNVSVSKLDIEEKAPSPAELDSMARGAGGYEKLIDTEGAAYKKGGFAYLDQSLSDLVKEHPEVLKTPLVRTKTLTSVGKNQKLWDEIAKLAKA